MGVDLDWGNDLGWEQPIAGESPAGRRFLVDGEHRTVAFEIRRGVGHGLDLGIRVPLEWRGGGILDGLIDWFHGFTRALGLPDNGRRSFARGRLRADLYRDGQRLAWDDRPGTGLGRVEVSGRWSFRAARPTSLAVIGCLTLPSGNGPFAGGRPAVGLQLVGARGVGDHAEAFTGLGASLDGETRFGGVEYSRVRPEAFIGVERRLGRRFSLIAQSNAAGRLIDDVDQYPGVQWYVSLGGRLRLDSGWAVEGGFTENLANQQATTDFGVQARVARGFGQRR